MRMVVASFRYTFSRQKEDVKRCRGPCIQWGVGLETFMAPSGFSRREPASQFQVAQEVITTE